MLTDFEPTIAQIDALIIAVADRAAHSIDPAAAGYAAHTLRDLAQARELLEVAQERTAPARQGRRRAEAREADRP